MMKYFKEIFDSANRMSNKQKQDSATVELNQTRSFESQLRSGLYVALSQLKNNAIGWTYRQSPVMLYAVSGQSNAVKNSVHLTRCCDALKKPQQWAWAATDKSQLCSTNNAVENNWCKNCFEQLDYQGYKSASEQQKQHIIAQFNFTKFVKTHSHHYFSTHTSKLWHAGEPLKELPSKPAGVVDIIQCQHCTWKLPASSDYILVTQQIESLGCENDYCLLCVAEHIDEVLIIPEAKRWAALQARFHYFNRVSSNWAHAHFHMDPSWHPLLKAIRQQGLALPILYCPIESDEYISQTAPLAWPDKKRAIMADNYDENTTLPPDWDIWRYSQVLKSLTTD